MEEEQHIQEQPAQRMFVLYDPETGAIAGTHIVDAGHESEEDPLAMVREGVREYADEEVLGRLEAAQLDLAPDTPPGAALYDPSKRELVPAPMLRLEASKPELEGDGEDTAEIAISVVTPDGRPYSGYSGEVVVRTSHGRLSERGGRVKLKNGEGSIGLTSGVATSNVLVTAADPSGVARPGRTVIEFI